MAFTTLISTAELADHLDDPNWVIVDCRFTLSDTEKGRNAYRECLQWCSTLSKRPEFYQEAARKLVNTVNDLDASLFQQNALILQALKVRDYVSACAECQRMVQMIPDPTHDYHRRAMEAIDRFCPRP